MNCNNSDPSQLADDIFNYVSHCDTIYSQNEGEKVKILLNIDKMIKNSECIMSKTIENPKLRAINSNCQELYTDDEVILFSYGLAVVRLINGKMPCLICEDSDVSTTTAKHINNWLRSYTSVDYATKWKDLPKETP